MTIAGLQDDRAAAVDRIREANENARAPSFQGLRPQNISGRQVVRELNAIMTVMLEDQPALLAQWKSISHVQRPNKRAASEPGATLVASSPRQMDDEFPPVATGPARSSMEFEQLDSPGPMEREEAPLMWTNGPG